MATIKLDKERELKFNLNALKKIKEKYGSLQADGSAKPYTRARCIPCYRQPQGTQPRIYSV